MIGPSHESAPILKACETVRMEFSPSQVRDPEAAVNNAQFKVANNVGASMALEQVHLMRTCSLLRRKAF